MSMQAASTDSPSAAVSSDAAASHGAQVPYVLLISVAGVAALLAVAAAWLWVTRGAAILLDIGQMFCL